MEDQKNIFNSLGPIDLKKNEKVYTEALDYAFSKEEVKNIAITGTYASGKSSVWETFKIYKKFDVKEVLTVTLGNYENTSGEVDEDSENKVKQIDNRVESQIINQILAQINSSEIPLSKYSFKENKSDDEINSQVSLTFLFLISIALLYFNKPILKALNLQVKPYNIFYFYLIGVVIFAFPVGVFLYNVFKNYKLRFLKIKIKEAEAELNNQGSDDETILDRNIKEIVYLLASSGTTVLVFEDLDRFNNVEIFVKLKELNFLVNAYLKTKKKNRVVRFVYLIKDGLFSSKDRTKFFDFILPIVPILDSKTSVNKFLELINNAQNKQKPQDKERDLTFSTILSISSYVDDMRLLKNIVNEYIVYSSIVPIDDLKLDTNKLFALITLKNIFPNEFELLQEQRGDIIQIFDNLEKYRNRLIESYERTYRESERLYYKMERETFHNMEKFVPDKVIIKSFKKPYNWSLFLKNWNKYKQRIFIMIYESEERGYQYNSFLKQFIYLNDEIQDEIENQLSEMTRREEDLARRRKFKERKKQQTRGSSYKDLLNTMLEDELDEFFNKSDYKIMSSNYFPLIKYLLVSGLLDETYWYYKSSPFIGQFESFKVKDIRFMIGLFEDRPLDIFLEVESPKEIINQLSEFDFSRKYILNFFILKQCLKDNEVKYIRQIIWSVIRDNNYSGLLAIMDKFTNEDCQKFVDIIINENRLDLLQKVLEECGFKNENTKVSILHYIFTNKNISIDELYQFKNILEETKPRESLFYKRDFTKFYENINLIDVKFKKLHTRLLNTEIIKRIERDNLFELNIENLFVILEEILNTSEINYGDLLDTIYENKMLKNTQNYINRNFAEFIHLYIKGNTNNEYFYNSENIVLKILNSTGLSEDQKLNYLENNTTKLSNGLEGFSNKIIKKLLDQDSIKFDKQSIRMLWLNLQKNIPELGNPSRLSEIVNKDTEDQENNDYKYEESFVNFICKHITPEFIKETKDDNLELYNYLAIWPQVRNCFEREAEILR